MDKYKNIRGLTVEQQQDLFVKFARCLGSIHNATEAANFIRDLFSEQEVCQFARRLQIADLLAQGLTYYEIRARMKVSMTTIAKVQLWLNTYGEGFRSVLKRTQVEPSEADFKGSWRQHKRKFAMYYWPELLLVHIVQAASKREKDRLLKVVSSMKEKTKLSRDLEKLLR